LKAQEPVVDSCGVTQPVEEEPNPHVKVTAIINASGKYWPDFPKGAPMPIPRVDLQVWLKTPGIPEIQIPEKLGIPVQIWSTDPMELTPNLYRDVEY
jgi:hypothetical protein